MKNNLSTEQKAIYYQSFLNNAFSYEGNIKLATKSEFTKLVNSEQWDFGWFGISKEKMLKKAKERMILAVKILESKAESKREKSLYRIMQIDIEDATNADYLFYSVQDGLRLIMTFKKAELKNEI
jgi:hypothetical protein